MTHADLEGLAVSTTSADALAAYERGSTCFCTYHAVGHAYRAPGDYGKALETFERAASLERYPHVLQHLAEAHAILGHTCMTREYWASTAPALPLYERIELPWRLEVLRQAATDAAVWQDLARQADQLLEHADFQTVWMHHEIGVAFARAGEWGKARRHLERLRRLPEGRPSGYWSTLGATLLEGELALVEGDYAAAIRLMALAVEQIHVARGARLGLERSGNATLQRLACRQLVLRAEEVDLAPDAPKLLAARQTLQMAA